MARKNNTGPTIEEDGLEEKRELLARNVEQRAELKALGDKLAAEIAELEAMDGIAERVANFTPAEKQALFQELRASGIESGEKFGTIGSKE